MSFLWIKKKMKREWTIKINFILDELFPPVFRNSKIFNFIFGRLAFGKEYTKFIAFKKEASSMNFNDFKQTYLDLAHLHIKRQTDLTEKSITHILSNICGGNILDSGCGNGFLCHKIATLGYNVTGVDIFFSKESYSHKNIKYVDK